MLTRTRLTGLSDSCRRHVVTISGGADAQERFPPRAAETAAPHKIAQTAQAILDARARYPESSLAAYGLASDTPEPGMVAHLFKLYSNLIGE